MTRTAPSDVVFLLPGFLGFDQLNDFHYFSDRAEGALRAALLARTGREIPVLPLATLPTSSLVDRQKDLRARIVGWLRRDELRQVKRIHLVGHSTGGVDAWLLLCSKPLIHSVHAGRPSRFDGTWDDEFRKAHAKLRGAVTLSAPFQGATITQTDALQLFAELPRGVLTHASGALVMARAALLLARRVTRRGTGPSDVAVNLIVDGRGTCRFLAEVCRSRELVTDLLPASMKQLMQHAPFPTGPHAPTVACFASVGPRPEKPYRERPCVPGERGARSFYRLCHDQVSGAVDPDFEQQVAANLAEMNHAGVQVFGRAHAHGRPLTASDNDGIVNTGSMLPSRGGRLAGLMVADHADVIGHYPRLRDNPEAPPQKPQWKVDDEGLFDSDAAFDDHDFFTLYGAVAEALAAHMA